MRSPTCALPSSSFFFLLLPLFSPILQPAPSFLPQCWYRRQHAPGLAAAALRKALAQVRVPRSALHAVPLKRCVQGGVAVGDIDALVVCTCTGYICPGVSSYLSQLLGIKVRFARPFPGLMFVGILTAPPCSRLHSCWILWGKAVELRFRRFAQASFSRLAVPLGSRVSLPNLAYPPHALPPHPPPCSPWNNRR